MSEANHELSLWLDEPGGLARSLFLELSCCRLSHERRSQGWVAEGAAQLPEQGSIRPLLAGIASKAPDFEPSAPLGRE